jgi:catechol 2,3-dioxygenase
MSEPHTIDPALRIAATKLAVSDLSRSVDFYERMLGLPLIARDGDSAQLGPDRAHPLLELAGLSEPMSSAPRSTGLFHVALLHPTRAGLAETVLRIAHQRWPIDGASDHGVSEALYLSDPDGLGLEIYADRPREQWRRPADGHGVEMYTRALDVEGLLEQASDPAAPTIEPGTIIGHVHLKTSDVARAVAFYRDALGMQEQARIPSAGFLSAGGYHHHIGLNSWQSAGAGPAPLSAPGLREVNFELSDIAAVEAIERGLRETAPQSVAGARGSIDEQGRLSLSDPDGNSLSFSS